MRTTSERPRSRSNSVRSGKHHRRPGVEPLEDRRLLADLYVSLQGSDANAPGNPAAPLKSIQHAVNVAGSGDVIRVAQGNYRYDQAADAEGGYSQTFGTNAVVFVANKRLSIIGGYSSSDWDHNDPNRFSTVINGSGSGAIGDNTYRGILVKGDDGPGTSLLLKGFSVAQGLARDIPKGTVVDAAAAGGGIFVDGASITLQQVFLGANKAEGGPDPVGGKAIGGGLYARSKAPVSLTDVVFLQNSARGGEGASLGGTGLGGGIFVAGTTVNGLNVIFENNAAFGGRTDGIGLLDGKLADGLGGGVALVNGAALDLKGAHFQSNGAGGGYAVNGNGGGGYGGGIYADSSRVTIRASDFTSNRAVGGDGPRNQVPAASSAQGGAVMAVNSPTTIDRTIFSRNGAGIRSNFDLRPRTLGGALALVGGSADVRATITTSLFERNEVYRGMGQDASRTGGGGAIWIDGPTTAIAQSTFALNQLTANLLLPTGQQGQAILVGTTRPTTLTLWYSIVSDHRNLIDPTDDSTALVVMPGSTANLKRNLFADNHRDSIEPSRPTAGGPVFTHAVPDIQANAVRYVVGGVAKPVALGDVQPDLRITRDSAAVNAASGSTASIDLAGNARVGTPDIGAYEANGVVLPSGPTNTFVFGGPRDVPVIADFDADGKDDFVVYGPAFDGENRFAGATDRFGNGVIYYFLFQKFGGPRDIPVVADYDGDGRADLAVYGPAGNGFNRFAVRLSTTGNTVTQLFGGPADVPVVGDFDGDGRTDCAVYGPAGDGFNRFAIRSSLTGTTTLTSFGGPRDVPVVGDFDGDGRDDITVYGPSNNGFGRFAILRSRFGLVYEPFGGPGDRPLATDIDGDGVDDIAVYGPDGRGFNRFAVSRSPIGFYQRSYGLLTDAPIVADFDGDRRTDVAVFGSGRLARVVSELTPPTAMLTTIARSPGVEAAIVPLPGASTPALELFRRGRARGNMLA